MFAFDDWADWLKTKVKELDPEQFTRIEYLDSRPFPNSALNPSFGLNLDSAGKVGVIQFWKSGLCDFTVYWGPNEAGYTTEIMLAANDETVPMLFARFLALYDERLT